LTDNTKAGPVVIGGVEEDGWTGWQPAGIKKKSRPPPKTTLFIFLFWFDS
jgi:hypothetical protein